MKVSSGEPLRDGAAALLAYLARRTAQAAIAAVFALPACLGSASIAAAEDRSLKLFFTHTGERATITFKRDGRFDPKGLAQINRFLRDWRRNEPARMDPRLLDLVWEVYDRSGATNDIHIVSAYRSPATNNMLRSRSRNTGVAKRSQHMLGKAMDFYIPGVKLGRLRALAMQMQVGGVGYYPTSGSPFVHLDVGNVRAWPRMSRQELVRVFPNGKTMHLPADGRPLPGYNQALANYRKRVGPTSIQVASSAPADDEDTAGAAPIADGSSLMTALLPTPKSLAKEALAAQTDLRAGPDGQPFPDLSSYSIPIPQMRAVALQGDTAPDADIKTASIGPITELPDARLSSALPIFGIFHSLAPAEVTLRTHMETMATLPMRASGEATAFGSMSGKALMTWALHAPGDVIGMRAPRVSQRTIQNAAASNAAVIGAAVPFDTNRFGAENTGRGHLQGEE